MDDVAWNHVLDQHVEMSEFLAETMTAIKTPDHREPDPRAGRGRFFRRGGPERWIRVVTEFSRDADRVVTAFPQSDDPDRAAGDDDRPCRPVRVDQVLLRQTTATCSTCAEAASGGGGDVDPAPEGHRRAVGRGR